MELSLSILLNELNQYHVNLYKNSTINLEFKRIISFSETIISPDSSSLYLMQGSLDHISLGCKCPKHIIISGDQVPSYYEQNAETILQITENISHNELMQIMMDIFFSYEKWNQDMLMAIIEHKSVVEFLNIAAEKLTNPIALLDNSLTLIAKAGEFKKPYSNTIWDKIEKLGYAPSDFFTLQEQQEYSNTAISNKDKPYKYSPVIDKSHTYVTSHIWIDDKLYGNVGSVSINTPFTEGQLFLIGHISKTLKYYYQNNEMYMGIAKNNTYFINHLLEDFPLSEDIVHHHLKRLHWNKDDNFYCLYFKCPIPLHSPIESMSFVKKINQYFPKSLISVYKDSIIAIVRHGDSPSLQDDEISEFENFLNKNEMKCGISSCFSNFMQLKYYFIQSRFAVENYNEKNGTPYQHYEVCHKEHIIYLLDNAIDLQCLCHTQILSLWSSQEENNQELIKCLYAYLLNGRNLSLTSKALHIHRNTLIYRINKISEILDLDLKNLSVEKMQYILFSCMLVEYI